MKKGHFFQIMITSQQSKIKTFLGTVPKSPRIILLGNKDKFRVGWKKWIIPGNEKKGFYDFKKKNLSLKLGFIT